MLKELRGLNEHEIISVSDGYIINGVKYPRVTSILNVISINQHILNNWYAKLGYEGAKKEGDDSRNFGTSVHKLIELEMQNPPVKSDYYSLRIQHAFNKFCNWKQGHRFTESLVEKTLYSKKYEYAGTADCITIMDDLLWILDWKTSSMHSLKHVLQLAAYLHAFEEMTGIKVDKAGCLILPKKLCDSRYGSDGRFKDIFAVYDRKTLVRLFRFFIHAKNLQHFVSMKVEELGKHHTLDNGYQIARLKARERK